MSRSAPWKGQRKWTTDNHKTMTRTFTGPGMLEEEGASGGIFILVILKEPAPADTQTVPQQRPKSAGSCSSCGCG